MIALWSLTSLVSALQAVCCSLAELEPLPPGDAESTVSAEASSLAADALAPSTVGSGSSAGTATGSQSQWSHEAIKKLVSSV